MNKAKTEEIERAIRQKRQLAEHHEAEAIRCSDPPMRQVHAELALDYREQEFNLTAQIKEATLGTTPEAPND